MALFGKIRRMHFRDGLSISEIARRTSLSRNTIRRWVTAEGGIEPKYHRGPQQKKLTPFEEVLTNWLDSDRHRPKRERRTAKALFGELQQRGFTGSYSRVSEFVRKWHDCEPDRGLAGTFIPLQFGLGEAFQFDWSEEPFVIGGIHHRLQVAHTKLCASRAFLLVAYPAQRHEMLFDAHTRAFTLFGGVPRRGIYDNMKTAVDRVQQGKKRVINTRFYAMTAYYLFDPEFCNVASGWEKGQVEKNVQDCRRRIWDQARQLNFSTLEELNRWLEQCCKAVWSDLMHPEGQGLTVAEAFDLEQAHLMPMPTPFDGYVDWETRASSTCLVAVDRNRYSVPCKWANKVVSIHQYAGHIDVYAGHEQVAQHIRSFERGKAVYEWQHYLPVLERKPGALRNGAPFATLPLPLQRLKAALLRQCDGDKVMVQVLACVPIHGLETVLVAVELVLESGVTSLEHIRNVLSRLKEPPQPPSIETELKLREEPRADPARYDRLKALEVVNE